MRASGTPSRGVSEKVVDIEYMGNGWLVYFLYVVIVTLNIFLSNKKPPQLVFAEACESISFFFKESFEDLLFSPDNLNMTAHGALEHGGAHTEILLRIFRNQFEQ